MPRAHLSASPSMLLEALPSPLLDFGSWYMNSLDVAPIQTKIATAATLAMTGDLIAQSMEAGPYDYKRGLSFGLFDAIYRGGFQHFTFPVIDATFNGDFFLSVFPWGDAALLAALERTLANQLVVRLSSKLTAARLFSVHLCIAWTCACACAPLRDSALSRRLHLAPFAGRPAHLLSALLFADRPRPRPDRRGDRRARQGEVCWPHRPQPAVLAACADHSV